jgi:uncharacterized protein DUF6265
MQIRLALALLLFASTGLAEEAMTANTLRLSRGQNSPAATIADMEWYAGRWTGTGLGGFTEEIWSPPREGTMMGMYRMIKDGKPIFYELLLIAQENGSLAIKLKHFHADLRGWEERDASLRFPLVAKRDGRLYFDGMTFERVGNDRVRIFLAIEKKDSVHEEIFEYTRAKPQ